jgi:hypothetical protein
MDIGKVFQITIKYTQKKFPRPSKIYPNLDFWYENMSSGNTATEKPNTNVKIIETS